MDTDPTKPAPPAVTSLRAPMAGVMERSLTEDIREEREDLREAAEQTLNVIVDLNLNGSIRWVSPSWVDVIGTQAEDVTGTPIADVIISEPTTIFTDVVESMQKDDSRSQFIRFAVKLGPLSKLLLPEQDLGLELENEGKELEPGTEPEPPVCDLEAQGIMVHDASGDSHVRMDLRGPTYRDNQLTWNS